MAARRVEVNKPGGEDRIEATSRHEEPGVELPTGPNGSGEDAGSEDGGVIVMVVRRWARGEEGGDLGRRWRWRWRRYAIGCRMEIAGRLEGRDGEKVIEACRRRRGC